MRRSENVITLKHYLVLCVTAFAAGVFIAVAMGRGTVIYLTIFLLALLFALTIIHIVVPLIKKQRIALNKSVLLPCFLIISTVFGILHLFHTELTSFSTLRNYVNESVWLTGTVSTKPRLSDNGYSYSFEFDIEQLEHKGTTIPTKGSVLMFINSSKGHVPECNQYIQCWTHIEEPSTARFEGDFDYSSYLRSKNIFLTGTTHSFNPVENQSRILSIRSAIKNAGIFINKKINAAANSLFPQVTADRAMLKSILTGDKSEFGDELFEHLSNAGISHISAVSGMHMSILFAAFTYLLMFTRLNRKIILLLTLPIILLFTSTAAFTPSVCRSALMLLVMILSVLLGERYASVNSLFLSLGVILLAMPYALFSKSLILSFSATLGIFVYFKYFRYFISKLISAPLFRPVVDCVALSLSAFIGTAYFGVIFFEKVSFAQFLTNLWIIPIVTLVFCGGYLSCIFYYILPQLSMHILRYPVAGGLRVICLTAEKFGSEAWSVKISATSAAQFTPVAYFALSLMLYLILKNLYDSSVHKSKSIQNSERFL